MDPTNNNPANGSGSGGESPAGVGVPSNAGTVNPLAANVASQSSSSTSTGAPSVGPRMSSTSNVTGARGTGAFAPGAYRPMSARPMNSGMMPAASMPIASGTGDIVLSKDTGGSSKSKKWWIIGGAIGAVLVMALVVLAIINNGGFGGPKATDLRSAFNIYANYFLTGEAKDEDVSGAGIDEEMVTEDDLSDVVEVESETTSNEASERDIEDESSSEEDGEIEELLNGIYFFENANGDEGKEYRETIKKYFDTFYGFYTDAVQDDENALEVIEEYKRSFDFLMVYYESGGLDEERMLELYNSEGKEVVEDYINEVIESFGEIGAIDDEDVQDLMEADGQNKLNLMSSYQTLGCLVDDEADYDCLETKGGEEFQSLLEESSKTDEEVMTLIDNAEINVYAGLYDLGNVINNEDGDTNTEEDDEES